MSPEETRCLELLDAHAAQQGCFLAEFFPKGGGDGSYMCCFRPLGKGRDLADRYVCKYVTIDPGTVRDIVANGSLPSTLEQLLDEELLHLLRTRS